MGRPSTVQQTPKAVRLPSRGLLGFEAQDYDYDSANFDSFDVNLSGGNGTAPVCDGVAGFDGSELPFVPELGDTYNLLSTPNCQLNARFSDKADSVRECALIAEVGLKYGMQKMSVLPDQLSEAGILVKVRTWLARIPLGLPSSQREGDVETSKRGFQTARMRA